MEQQGVSPPAVCQTIVPNVGGASDSTRLCSAVCVMRRIRLSSWSLITESGKVLMCGRGAMCAEGV